MSGEYKTAAIARSAARAKLKRDAIKTAGGEAYAALLEKERLARKAYREKHPDYWQDGRRKQRKNFRARLCAAARKRGRKKGLEATITPANITWPSHCPVLGIELDYPEYGTKRKDGIPQPNWPSLDRWDCSKGYIPGNVFVISFRANTLKGNVSREEILKIAQYVMRKPTYSSDEKTGSLLECVADRNKLRHLAEYGD